MKKFIITEEDKKHIMGLYEQISPFSITGDQDLDLTHNILRSLKNDDDLEKQVDDTLQHGDYGVKDVKINSDKQDEKVNRRVKMMVEKLGLEVAIKMLGDIKVIKNAYKDNPLGYLDNLKDLEVVESPDYPNSIFYMKNGVVVMERDKQNKIFLFDSDIWSFFERFLDMEDQEIARLLIKWLEETLNLEGYIPQKIWGMKRGSWKKLSI